MKKVLIVDDEIDIRTLARTALKRAGHEVETASDLQQAKQHLKHTTYDVCITDVNLPDGNGLDLVKHIQQENTQTPIAVITAYGNTDLAVDAMKLGAFDFLSKPVDIQQLRQLVNHAINLPEASSQTGEQPLSPEKPNKQKPEVVSHSGIIGQSQPVKILQNQIHKVARSQAPVFIFGESGTGKELAAKTIHEQSPRAQGPFVAVNCGAIPQELMESEFFGHKKGSFTGAISDHQGLFAQADGGTLLLDEIADLPLAMQVKLLRAIQEKSVRPVGGSKEESFDVRILSASHQDLKRKVAQGQFRQDLFYRLNVIQINVPALKDRPEDIPLLTQHLLKKICHQWGIEELGIDKGAMSALKAYDFPGNIRELENTLERAATLAEEDTITESSLDLIGNNADLLENDLADQSSRPDAMDLDTYLNQIENEEIVKAMKASNGNQTQAAKSLGITLRSIRYRISKMNGSD